MRSSQYVHGYRTCRTSFLPSSFPPTRFSFVSCLSSSFPSLEIKPPLDEKHACVLTGEKTREDGERKKGNRDAMGPRRGLNEVFSVYDNDSHQQQRAPLLLPTFLVPTSLMFLYSSWKG